MGAVRLLAMVHGTGVRCDGAAAGGLLGLSMAGSSLTEKVWDVNSTVS